MKIVIVYYYQVVARWYPKVVAIYSILKIVAALVLVLISIQVAMKK